MSRDRYTRQDYMDYNQYHGNPDSSEAFFGYTPDEDFKKSWQIIKEKGASAYCENEIADSISKAVSRSFNNEFQYNTDEKYIKSKKSHRARRGHTFVKNLLFTVLILSGLYMTLVFSNIPFISKWRTIYIETAMGTMNHQWLATLFLPKSVIDQAVSIGSEIENEQAGLKSDWYITDIPKKYLYLPWDKAKSRFSDIYSEIDQDSFNDYINKYNDEFINENGYLVIDKAGLKDKGTTVTTIYGDKVLAVDTENAITIVKIEGKDYVGRLAIIKDPSRVGLGLSKNFNKSGDTIENLAKSNDAVLAVNASGFLDPEGHGNGGNVYGLVISGGKVYKKAEGGRYKTIGFDKNDKLNIGDYSITSSLRDAMEFKPALIINGKILVSGSAGWGIQPRTAIGQTKNGQVLILVVDGRAPGYSLGCTVGDLAQIMKRYGAFQACNLDGGSSSLMYYNGRGISKTSAANKSEGRRVPDGFVVYNR